MLLWRVAGIFLCLRTYNATKYQLVRRLVVCIVMCIVMCIVVCIVVCIVTRITFASTKPWKTFL